MKRIAKLVLLAVMLMAVLITVALAGCGGEGEKPTPTASQTPVQTPEPTPRMGGTLRLAVGEMESLDPYTSIGGFELNYHYQNFDTLVTMKPDMSIGPGLAKSWEMPEPNAIVFHLREGVKFHDGTDFNASSVKWNVERLKDPAINSPHAGMLASVSSVDVIDNYTVRFNLTQPDVTLLANLSDRAGMMISPAAGELYGRGRTDLYDHPIGTGPFMVTKYVHDDYIVMERFPNYWDKGKPYLDRLEFKLIPDPSAALASLRAGAVDLIVPETIPVEYLSQAQKISGTKVIMGEAAGFSIVLLNKNYVPLSDLRVREALAWAWDRDAEIAAYGGVGSPELGLLPRISWAYNPEVEKPEYSKHPANLEKAKRLLAEAGYPDGFDLTLTTINNPDYIKRSQILQEQWAKIGVRVTLNIKDLNAALTSIVAGDFQAAPANHSGRSDPGVHMALLNHSKSGYNRANVFVTSQEFDDLLDTARQTLDVDKRKELYYQAQLVFAQMQPMLLGINTPVFVPVREYVQGVDIYPDRKCRLKEVWLSR